MADFVLEMVCTLARPHAASGLGAALKAIEQADRLIVGTPISSGSYTDLLKHLLDLVTSADAEGRAAIIAATDHGDCNLLTLETSLRANLKHLGYPAVYARDDDFVNLTLQSVRWRFELGETFEKLSNFSADLTKRTRSAR